MMSRKRIHLKPHSGSWVSYERSYVVTVGLAFLIVSVLIWNKQGERYSEWPTWSQVVFFALPILGLALVAIGLLAGRESIEKWADAASRHEASIILLVVAFPVYLAMSLFDKRR